MTERRDIPDALREAVERTVQATVETRVRAQDAVDDLAGTVDQVVKGAEKNITRSRRSVRAAVGERLPATQDDVKAILTALRRIEKRLDVLEERSKAGVRSKQPKANSKSKQVKAHGKSKSSKTKSKPKR